MVCDVLRGLVGHQAHEGHLDVDVLGISSIHAVLELERGDPLVSARVSSREAGFGWSS